MGRTGPFKRNEHIKKAREISKLYKQGNKVGTWGAKLFYKENGLPLNRIAFTLPRGYGRAVDRNKSKRLSREAYRFYKSHLNTGYDLLLLVYPGNDSFHTRCGQLKTLCRKAGLMKD
ncbi:MAG: ribonuclease P protein component [Treponema sp.]|nr:ribonuclease P protein component [Treponema sp.]